MRPGHVERVEVAGPGFLNFYLAPTWLHEVLRAVAAQGERYGHGTLLRGRAHQPGVRVANPTGPLHAGGGRWVAVGDAIANLLEAQGAEVHREYYLNDAGVAARHVRGVAARPLPRTSGLPEDGYQGPVPDRHGRAACATSWATRSPRGGPRVGLRGDGRGQLRDDLGRHRRALRHLVLRAHAARERRGGGGARRPRASGRASTSEDGATWLRTADFGDTRDRVLVSRDGSSTYLAADLAYHRDKFARGFDAPHRHLGRRPPRAGEVAAERHGGARLPTRRAGDDPRPAREAAARRRGRAPLEAHRQHRHPGRHPRRGRPRRRPAHVPPAEHRHDADVRPRRRHRAVDGEPRVLRAVRARPDRVDRPQGGRAGRGPAPGPRRRPRACSCTSARWSCSAPSALYPDVVREAADAAGTAPRDRPGCATSPSTSTASTATAGCSPTTTALTQARLWLAETCRIGLADALGLLGVRAPDEMSPTSTTTT